MKVRKMMVYVTNDGATFRGYSANDVVSEMRADQWATPSSNQEYMDQVKVRVANQYGAAVRTDDPESFLHDLEIAGLLKRQA
jgi:hypothetical protein